MEATILGYISAKDLWAILWKHPIFEKGCTLSLGPCQSSALQRCIQVQDSGCREFSIMPPWNTHNLTWIPVVLYAGFEDGWPFIFTGVKQHVMDVLPPKP